MKLSAFFSNIGHPIAYYAKLNNITGSATATIFISQFLYWEGWQRDPGGWIYKTQAEIEEETGLNRREQEAARKQLKSVGLLKERRVGLPARMEFLPVLEEFDRQWEVYLESGSSAALAGKKQASEKRIQNFSAKTQEEGSNPHGCQFVRIEQTCLSESDKLGENASNPHGCQFVRIEQTCLSESDKPVSPDWTDNLYTEITSEITYTKSAKEKIASELGKENQEKGVNGDPESRTGTNPLPVQLLSESTDRKPQNTASLNGSKKEEIPPAAFFPADSEKLTPREIHPTVKSDRRYHPLPEWRKSTKRFDFDSEFVDYIQRQYLPTVPAYQKTKIDRATALSWINKGLYDAERSDCVELQWAEFKSRQERRQTEQRSIPTMADGIDQPPLVDRENLKMGVQIMRETLRRAQEAQNAS